MAGTFKPPRSSVFHARVQGERTRAVGSQHEPRDRGLALRQTLLGNKATRNRRRGRKRKSRSMGRYPFLTATKAYLGDVRHYYRPTSLEENGRKLRYLAKVF